MSSRIDLMIVEDDPDDLLLLRRAIEHQRPQLSLAVMRDGTEVIDCIKQAKPAPGMVLLDLNMPRMDGRELLAAIRESRQWPEVPLVVLTTSTEVGDRERVRKLGACAFYSKPNGFKELVATVGEIIDRWLAEPASEVK